MNLKMITCIVHRGHSDKVVKALVDAGVEGYTIYQGRGLGIHEKQIKLLSYTVEPPKEVIFSIVPAEDARMLLKIIEEAAEFEKPGTGMAFIQDVEEVSGINHPIQRLKEQDD